METLALMLAAVALSLLVGMPIGVLAGRSDRVQRAITPVLDAMQIVPAFAYLMPVVILFSVGPAAAVISTMVYAIPPAVRITALGIRGVHGEHRRGRRPRWARPAGRRCFKVQLPLARRMMLLAVNQTILFALSMVVIAGLIGGRGLGDVVTNGLYSYPALAILGGVAIVIMAITLDRATAAIAERTDPATPPPHRRAAPAAAARVAPRRSARSWSSCSSRARSASPRVYPDEFETSTTVYAATFEDWLLARIQSVLDYVQDPDSFVFAITEPIGNFLVEYGLEPLRAFLVETPWFVTVAAAVAIAFVVSGRRPRSSRWRCCSRSGSWASGTRRWTPPRRCSSRPRSRSRSAFALGVWAAESRRVERTLRPILDVLQTLPQLVYIIPFIYLMPVSRVPGVVASVLVRDAGRDPPRRRGRARRGAERGRGGVGVRRDAPPGAREGEDPARARRDHARRQPGNDHGPLRGRDRRPRRARARSATWSRAGSSATSSGWAWSPRSRSSRSGSCSTGSRRERRASEVGSGMTSEDGKGGLHESSRGALDRAGARCWRSRRGVRQREGGRARSAATAAASAVPAAARRGVRHGHDQRERVGRLDGQRLHREVRARERARLQGRGRRRSRRSPSSRRWPTARSTRCSRTGSTSTSTRRSSTKAGTVVQGGPLGVEGHIGWFIPKYLMDANPEFATWEGLKGKEDLFKTAESGSQGMFLGGDPSYVQKDKELIEALGLNFKHVTAGAEPAQVARWSQLYKQEKPVIFYWYTPQYLNQEYELAEVELPPRTRGLQGRREVRRRRPAVQVRVRRDDHQQALQQGVRGERLARVRRAEEDDADERGPGGGREGDRRRQEGSGGRRPGVGGGERVRRSKEWLA